ncbi:MAG: hypothetical protein RL514_976 [Verrucomicrobiota bacterium]
MSKSLTEVGEQKRRFEVLAGELGIANTHLYIYRKLTEAREAEFADELYKALDFWGYTIQAHVQAAVLRLCRVYDSNGETLGLQCLLQCLVRAARIGHLNSQVTQKRFAQQVKSDLNFCAGHSTDALVKKLRVLRCKFVAHRNHEFSMKQTKDSLAEYPLTIGELQSLIDDGFSVLERWARWSKVYDAYGEGVLFPRYASGKDDYLFVLKSLKSALQQPKRQESG